MKYVIFAYNSYYPTGGIHDLVRQKDGSLLTFDTVADAKDAILRDVDIRCLDNIDIVHRETLEVEWSNVQRL